MLGTVFFDEKTTSSIYDAAFDVGAGPAAAGQPIRHNGKNIITTSENSFVAQSGTLQVAAWVDSDDGIAKIAVLDRVGARQPRLIRALSAAASAPPLNIVGVAVAELPSNLQQQQSGVVTFAAVLCTADARVVDATFTASPSGAGSDDGSISVQMVRYNWRELDTDGRCNPATSPYPAEVTAFGLCSAPVNMRGELSFVVALSNGDTFLATAGSNGNSNGGGSQEERVFFSVDEGAVAAEVQRRRREAEEQAAAASSGSSSPLSAITSWLFGGGNSNEQSQQQQQQQQNRKNVPTTSEHADPSVTGRSRNHVTSVAFCASTRRLFLCCADGRLMFYDSASRAPRLVQQFPWYLRCRQILAPSYSEQPLSASGGRVTRGGAAAAGAPASPGSPASSPAGGGADATAPLPAVLYTVCDDESSSWLISFDTARLEVLQHWSAVGATGPRSRCVRIEPPHRGGLDMPVALWQLPEAGISVLWSSAFGVAHLAAPVLSFFQSADDGLLCIVLPGAQLAVVREERQMSATERVAAGLAVAARPAVDEHATTLFPTRNFHATYFSSGGGAAGGRGCTSSCSSSLLVHPAGGSALVTATIGVNSNNSGSAAAGGGFDASFAAMLHSAGASPIGASPGTAAAGAADDGYIASGDNDLSRRLPRAIRAGVALLHRTQMWAALDDSIGRLLTEPDASASPSCVASFVDAAALLSAATTAGAAGADGSDVVSDDDMMAALCFVMDPAVLVELDAGAALHVRTKRWVADRLSQALFSGVVALFAARIGWTASTERSNDGPRHAAVERNVALSLSLLCSAYQAVSALGPNCSVLVAPATATAGTFASDVGTVAACLATLLGSRHLYGSVTRRGSNEHSGTDSAAGGLSQQTNATTHSSNSSSIYVVVEDIAADSERIEQAVVGVAHRLLVAAQTYGRTKALSMWVSYWTAECPIMNHFAAVLLAAHRTGDARPGVASLRFAQHLHTACAAITSFAEREAARKSGRAAPPTADAHAALGNDAEDAGGMFGAGDNDDGAAGGDFGGFGGGSFARSAANQSTGTFFAPAAVGGGVHKPVSSKLARLIIDLLHNTSAALGDSRQQSSMLDDIISYLDATPVSRSGGSNGNKSKQQHGSAATVKAQHPELEACRLYRATMLMLFLNDGGASASFQCEPHLVESILCDVQQVHEMAVAAAAPNLERLMSYLLVECALFLSAVAVQRRDFFRALDHLSSVCRNDGTRSGQVSDTVAAIVQLVLESPEAQQQLIAAPLNDEPLLRAVNSAIHETILQAAQQQNVSRAQRHTAAVQHTVFFCQFLASRGAIGSAARVAHDVASLMRSFTRCSERTLRLVARLLSLAIDLCRAIPAVEQPNIVVSADGAVTAGSSGHSSRRGELTGLGGQDLDVQQSMAFNLGQAGASASRSFMVFRPSGVARRPLMRRHAPELQRRLRWVLCEAKLASRAPVNRPAWSDDLDAPLADADALRQTVKELLHARLWADAASLCDAYPAQLHPACVFQVRAHDLLGECTFALPGSLAISSFEQPTLPASSSSSNQQPQQFGNPLLSSIQRSALGRLGGAPASAPASVLQRYSAPSIDIEAGEDAAHVERSAQLVGQWVELLNDIDAGYSAAAAVASSGGGTGAAGGDATTTTQREILRRVVEQLLAHENGDNVPRFVFDALYVLEPSTLLQLCLNSPRTSLPITNLAFDVVLNFFAQPAAKRASTGGVLAATLLERLVIGAKKQMERNRANDMAAKLQAKSQRVRDVVTKHLQGAAN